MLWQLAIRTLLADRGKLLAGLIGVVFSIVLVNVQGGLFLGLIGKASLLVNRGTADIWVGHHEMHNVDFPHDIPTRWLHRIQSCPGVRAVEVISIGFSEMSLPNGGFEGVMVYGVETKGDLGRVWQIVEGPADALSRPHGVIVDQYDDDKLAAPSIGEMREIGGVRARITGKSRGMHGFLVTPYVFTTLDRAAAFTDRRGDTCSYFLVKAVPGANIAEVCDAIRQRLPSAEVMPAKDYAAVSIRYWMLRTGLGISFGASTLLGLLVGLVMVGQTLYAMVLDRLTEFATLKAIGASEREVVTVLLSQAAGIAGLGIVIGTTGTLAFRYLYDSPRAPIHIPMTLMLVSSAGVFLMCLFTAILPYLRVRNVDPHSVLQG